RMIFPLSAGGSVSPSEIPLPVWCPCYQSDKFQTEIPPPYALPAQGIHKVRVLCPHSAHSLPDSTKLHMFLTEAQSPTPLRSLPGQNKPIHICSRFRVSYQSQRKTLPLSGSPDPVLYPHIFYEAS